MTDDGPARELAESAAAAGITVRAHAAAQQCMTAGCTERATAEIYGQRHGHLQALLCEQHASQTVMASVRYDERMARRRHDATAED